VQPEHLRQVRRLRQDVPQRCRRRPHCLVTLVRSRACPPERMAACT
jgi:hypothetical protein